MKKTRTNQQTNTTKPVGWGNAQQNEPSFGGGAQDGASIKAKTINLINSVRTLMRSTLNLLPPTQAPNWDPEYQGTAILTRLNKQYR